MGNDGGRKEFMALRIRANGRILCAALHPPDIGDTYIPDGLAYQLSAIDKVLVTEAMPAHEARGEWWWAGNVPVGITIDPYYVCARGGNHKS